TAAYGTAVGQSPFFESPFSEPLFWAKGLARWKAALTPIPLPPIPLPPIPRTRFCDFSFSDVKKARSRISPISRSPSAGKARSSGERLDRWEKGPSSGEGSVIGRRVRHREKSPSSGEG